MQTRQLNVPEMFFWFSFTSVLSSAYHHHNYLRRCNIVRTCRQVCLPSHQLNRWSGKTEMGEGGWEKAREHVTSSSRLLLSVRQTAAGLQSEPLPYPSARLGPRLGLIWLATARLKSSATLINLNQMNDLININISTLHRGKSGPAPSGSASDEWHGSDSGRRRRGWNWEGLLEDGEKKKKKGGERLYEDCMNEDGFRRHVFKKRADVLLCLKNKPRPSDACLHGFSPGTATSKSQQQEHLCRVHTDTYTASKILGFHTLGEKRHSVLCKTLAVAHSPWGPIHKSYLIIFAISSKLNNWMSETLLWVLFQVKPVETCKKKVCYVHNLQKWPPPPPNSSQLTPVKCLFSKSQRWVVSKCGN